MIPITPPTPALLFPGEPHEEGIMVIGISDFDVGGDPRIYAIDSEGSLIVEVPDNVRFTSLAWDASAIVGS